MLIAIEKDIAIKIISNKNQIVDKIAESSAEMMTILLLQSLNYNIRSFLLSIIVKHNNLHIRVC